MSIAMRKKVKRSDKEKEKILKMEVIIVYTVSDNKILITLQTMYLLQLKTPYAGEQNAGQFLISNHSVFQNTNAIVQNTMASFISVISPKKAS